MRISDWSSDVCSSDLTRCSRPPASRSARLFSTLATLWSMVRPAKSSPIRAKRRPRTILPAATAEKEHAMVDHTVKAFDSEIGQLRGLVAEMGGLAEVAIRDAIRSEERRAGKEGVSPCRSRGSPDH